MTVFRFGFFPSSASFASKRATGRLLDQAQLPAIEEALAALRSATPKQ
jgi:hypothetical protein